jgi:hypothetical protein
VSIVNCEHSPTMLFECFFLTVNGQWSSWSAYDECSVNCGIGTRTRTRTCNNPPPQYGGLHCAGNSNQSINCTANNCPGTNPFYAVLAGQFLQPLAFALFYACAIDAKSH